MMTEAAIKAEFAKVWKKAHALRVCCHPDAPKGCSDKVIRAHTVSRAAGLARIARKGHVYMLKVDFWASDDSERMPCKDVGIKEATTFSGFCARHDAELFAPLETQPFHATQEQLHLLGYRAICREYFLKRVMVRAFDANLSLIVRHYGKHSLPFEQMYVSRAGARAGLEAFQAQKTLYEEALTSKDYTAIHSLVFHTSDVPSFLVSGGPSVEFDFVGRRLQYLARAPFLQVTTLNVTAFEGGGAVVLHWHKTSDEVSRGLAATLLMVPPDRRADALTRLAFETIENLAASPVWWDGLTDDQRDALTDHMDAGTHIGVARGNEGLLDDGREYGAFKILRVDRRYFDQEPDLPAIVLRPY
jgi:hypothetical protein